MGLSGSGKTSLLNLIGLLDTPNSGRISINGQPIATQANNVLSILRNKLIGFIFQNFNLVPVLSAIENVMLPLQIRGEPAAESRATAALGVFVGILVTLIVVCGEWNRTEIRAAK